MALTARIISAGNSPNSAQQIVGDFASGLTATGNSQATALALGAAVNAFSTVASSTGAILPGASPGDSVKVWNAGAQTLSVYGQGTEAIGSGGASAAFSVATTKGALFTKVSNTLWIPILSA